MQEAEDLLAQWKHPDPYRPPTAPGGRYPYLYAISLLTATGSKYERNLPAPILDRKFSGYQIVALMLILCSPTKDGFIAAFV